MIKVEVSGLGRHLPTGRWLLLLREERTTRCLAIVIALVDAHAIALRLAKNKLQRPLTHNLIQNLIEALGGKISCVCIDHTLSDGRLCAQIVVVVRERRLGVDCCPSDAVVLALQASAPIVTNSPSLPDAVRERLVRLAGNRITGDGVLVIEAGQFRSQERNRQDALNRLVKLICKAARKPKTRRKTKPTGASKERRLKNKRRRSEIKHMRQPPLIDPS